MSSYLKFKRLSFNQITLIIILLAFFIAGITYLLKGHVFYWDEAVYIAMGKQLAGDHGLWETIRPPLLPILYGIIWKVGVHSIIYYRGLVLVSGILAAFIVYILSKKLYNEQAGIIAVLFLLSSIEFFENSNRALSNIPSIALAVLSVYYFIKGNNFFISGLFIGLSFLTRFTQAIIFVGLLMVLIYLYINKKSSLTEIFSFLIGFSLVFGAYLVSNFILYDSFFAPLIEANKNATFGQKESVFYYILNDKSFSLLFGIIGIVYLVLKKKVTDKVLALVIPSILIFLYWSYIQPHIEMRYMVDMLPYFSIFSGILFYEIFQKMRNAFGKTSYVFIIVGIFVVLFPSLFGIYSIIIQSQHISVPEEFLVETIDLNNTNKNIYASTPFVAFFSNDKIVLDYCMEENLYKYKNVKDAYFILNSGYLKCGNSSTNLIFPLKEENITLVKEITDFRGIKYYLYETIKANN